MEVFTNDYDESNGDSAIEIGKGILSQGGAKSEIFAFNGGIDKRVFPNKHPYYSCRQMGSCGKVELAAKFGKNDLCKGCMIISGVRREQTRQKLKRTDKEVKTWTNNKLGKNKIVIQQSEFIKTKKIAITNPVIKNYLGHAKDIEAKELIYKIDKLEFELIGSSKLGASKDMNNAKDKKNVDEKRKRGVVSYNYYKAKYGKFEVLADFEVHKNKYEQPYSIRIKKP